MKVKRISDGAGSKGHVIVFSEGDEAFSGLLDFGESIT